MQGLVIAPRRPAAAVRFRAAIEPRVTVRRHRRRNAFTLIEALIAATVLAVAVLAISMSLCAGHVQSREAVHGRRAIRLAEEMMEYIVSRPYYDPDGSGGEGPEGGETDVSTFDNMDDFDVYVDPPGALTDMAGNAYPLEYQAFRRSAEARYTTAAPGGLGASIPGLSVTITVSGPAGRRWRMTRFVPKPTD